MSAVDVRCAGCGRFHSREFIRCAHCRTTTRESTRFWAREAERTAARRRGVVVIPSLAIAGWGLVALIVWAFV